MEEYQENKLILKDVSKNAIEILIFSSKYLIDELIETCLKFIKNNLEFETVVDILKLSDLMNLTQLIDYSYQFILENFEEFIKTSFFLELEENHLNLILLNDYLFINEFELFQSIIKWGKHKSNINQEKENQKLEKEEKEKLQDQISNIIDKIRFIDFSNKELADILKEELIPNEISQQLIKLLIIKTQENENELNQFIEKQNSLIFKSRMKFKSSTIIQEKKQLKKLEEWINDDEFLFKMKLGYSTKKDGFDCKKWHDICDNKGKTLIIIKTKDNYIFGGFTSIGFINDKSKWREKDRSKEYGYIPDSNAFIFSLRNDKNDRKPEKFSIQKGKEQYAIWSYSTYGPCFAGGPDFRIETNLQNGYSNFGHTYNLPNGIEYGTNEARSYLAGSIDKWKVHELETYFI
ncbi:pep-cterm sorting domain-containing protein [Anaeramoeba ignava]|uniref:Pep-cterm sorting domain-containing protein n=1 Tax=Anaeramoeba ignava TaxID=1746090 RepID=A0A9Q0LI68_ANAIG|nr:pep-cterm sorting domain-containing protein [Anaeramoeba ignava]